MVGDFALRIDSKVTGAAHMLDQFYGLGWRWAWAEAGSERTQELRFGARSCGG